ncbi:hypothetical protein QYZ44_26725 [Vibrio parahaemolyticus]|nr:hypothetical protein [Vibrio parahaemolyticus]MDN4712312.1 hypothetical protein [Vibrio parahaemolyticus]
MSEDTNPQPSTSDKIKGGGILAICAFILYSCVGGGETFQDNKDKSLKEFYQLTLTQRHDIIDDYVDEHDLSKEKSKGFYSCVSQMLHTKSTDLTLDTVTGWCQTDYDQNKLTGYVNFDEFEKGFSAWDGSFRELESAIKNAMNDPDSYEHVKTTYRLVLHGTDTPKAIVSTEFRGKNGFGGIVKNNATASVNISNGKIIEFIQ